MSAGAVASGILVVDKAAGMTSFDVVTLVRRRLGVRRVGHGGTLDPEAVGVLPILVGEATKLMPYLLDHDKEYVVLVRLGVTTDTQDLTGRVTSTAPVPALALVEAEEACARFVGRIRQVPPMYSAVHRGGRRLYELAREGIEVSREAREVVIRSIVVEDLALPLLTLRVVCERGTYLRALAADLGERLGCGGAVARLVRTRVGPWDRGAAMPVDLLREAAVEPVLARLLPCEAALPDWPWVRLDASAAHAFVNGQPVRVPAPPCGGPAGLVRAQGPAGEFLGVGEVLHGRSEVRPVRILHADRSRTGILPV